MYVLHASPSFRINISHLKRKWFRKQPWRHSYPVPWCFPVSLLAFSPTAVTLTSVIIWVLLSSLSGTEVWEMVITSLLETIRKLFQEITSQVFFLKARKDKFLYKSNVKSWWNEFPSSFVLVNNSSGITWIVFMIFHGDCQICQMKWKLAKRYKEYYSHKIIPVRC